MSDITDLREVIVGCARAILVEVIDGDLIRRGVEPDDNEARRSLARKMAVGALVKELNWQEWMVR
jgi:hypothetical protein